MFRNYLKTAWRSFMRQKEYSVLNVVGLSVGLACCIVILLFVSYEWSFDRFHSKGERIFRVVQKTKERKDLAWTGGVTRQIVQDEFGEVEKSVSFQRVPAFVAVEREGETETFREENMIFSDEGFFDLFDFPLLKGDIGTSLAEPQKMLITEEMATKYFGTDDPIGKSLDVNGGYEFVVTGVLHDIPENSHIQFDFLTSMASFKVMHEYPVNASFTSHWWPSVWTYALLRDPSDVSEINARFAEVMKKHREAEEVDQFKPQLQPITDIHLRSDMVGEFGQNGSMKTVAIFLAVAAFTLILACINFMNLATARAVKRAREIGVRKAIGAERKQLIFQFFFESFLMNIVAFLVAILLADLVLPWFGVQLERQLSFSLFNDPKIWMSLVGIILLSAFMSGAYPALFLSGFKPASVLKTSFSLAGGRDIRKALVIFQFALSVFLIFGTSVAYLQIRYFKDANLGFDKEHIVMLKSSLFASARYDALKNELMKQPMIKDVCGVTSKPGIQRGWNPPIEFEGSNPNDKSWMFNQQVDTNFFKMMGIPVIAGRGFSSEFNDEGVGTLMRGQFPSFTDRNFIVNESAVKYLGKTNETVLGMKLRFYTEENGQLFSDVRGRVVGVVKDYHTANLKNGLMPTCFSPVRSEFGPTINYFLVKLTTGKFSEAEAQIREAWRQAIPEVPIEFTFLDDELDQQYQDETRLGNVVGTFAVIALFISCLGLFGLSAYTVETRTKEIGIRKVMGASETKIVRLLSKDFLLLVSVGVLIALPLGWWAMTNWLNQFAFRISISPLVFIGAGCVAILIAMITVSFQSLRAAHLNPVKSLRSE
ncbi:MAG: ABC transporter permease [Cyclobacteriaceae bacterium]|nr:ABC transporter permease [Cyclobacteriaceae bacterium]